MKIVLTFKRQGRKPRVVEIGVDTLDLTDARVLYEVEQRLNSLPGIDMHIHVDLVK